MLRCEGSGVDMWNRKVWNTRMLDLKRAALGEERKG